MGRRPIGKRAMTATERSHRYRAKHAATKSATKQSEADAGALAAEIARFKAVGAEKDREIDRLRKELAQARAAAKVSGEIDPATLAPTAREKLEAAVRQHKKNLDNSFQRSLREGIQKHINEVLLPMYGAKIQQAEKIIGRRPPFSKDEFRVLLRALHSDSTNEKLRNEAFSLVKEREDMLRAPEPGTSSNFPRTAAELARQFASNKGRR